MFAGPSPRARIDPRSPAAVEAHCRGLHSLWSRPLVSMPHQSLPRHERQRYRCIGVVDDHRPGLTEEVGCPDSPPPRSAAAPQWGRRASTGSPRSTRLRWRPGPARGRCPSTQCRPGRARRLSWPGYGTCSRPSCRWSIAAPPESTTNAFAPCPATVICAKAEEVPGELLDLSGTSSTNFPRTRGSGRGAALDCPITIVFAFGAGPSLPSMVSVRLGRSSRRALNRPEHVGAQDAVDGRPAPVGQPASNHGLAGDDEVARTEGRHLHQRSARGAPASAERRPSRLGEMQRAGHPGVDDRPRRSGVDNEGERPPRADADSDGRELPPGAWTNVTGTVTTWACRCGLIAHAVLWPMTALAGTVAGEAGAG